jgi:hypothetical protein
MPTAQFNEISVFVMAHADDCQLFMQPQMFTNLTDEKRKNVFIITTAGDAGFEEKFWKAREEGMKSSVRFCLATLGEIVETTGSEQFNGHLISFCKINNSIVYFLRLPDGNLDNEGFASTNYQSLQKLRNEKISSITAIDKSTSYTAWQDLQNTLKEIILFESSGISRRLLHYLNPDESKNVHDHADHINTGHALQMIHSSDGFEKKLFNGYCTADHPKNLDSKELFWKAAMFAAYEKAVFDAGGYSTLREDTIQYCKWCSCAAEFTIVSE